jgi:hypothetical protein
MGRPYFTYERHMCTVFNVLLSARLWAGKEYKGNLMRANNTLPH